VIEVARALALAGSVARLGGPLGEAARAAHRELAQASRSTRASWLADVRAPLPAGLRAVHPSWIEAALAPLPARARDVLAAGPRDSIDVWLARWACAELPPLPALRDDRRPGSLADAIAMARLAEWLTAVGRAQLAYAASLAAPGAPRRDELGAARDVIARCRGTLDLRVIGARAVAPYVRDAGALTARQLAVRLPRELALEAELRGHATGAAPRWDALRTALDG